MFTVITSIWFLLGHLRGKLNFEKGLMESCDFGLRIPKEAWDNNSWALQQWYTPFITALLTTELEILPLHPKPINNLLYDPWYGNTVNDRRMESILLMPLNKSRLVSWVTAELLIKKRFYCGKSRDPEMFFG